MINTKICTDNNKHSKSNRPTASHSRMTTTMWSKKMLMCTGAKITEAETKTTKPPTTTLNATITTTATKAITAHRKNRNIREMIRWSEMGMGNGSGSGSGISFGGKLSLWLLILLLTASAIDAVHDETLKRNGHIAITATTTAEVAAESPEAKYSQPLTTNTDDDSFRPIIPKDYSPEYISRNVFTESGQYRVFQSDESDLRRAVSVPAMPTMPHKGQHHHKAAADWETGAAMPKKLDAPIQPETKQRKAINMRLMAKKMDDTGPTYVAPMLPLAARRSHREAEVGLNEIVPEPLGTTTTPPPQPSNPSDAFNSELMGLETLLVEYVENFFQRGQYEPLPGLVLELQKNQSGSHGSAIAAHQRGDSLRRYVRHVAQEGSVSVNIPRALQTGRLFFFTGLKKLVWPIMMGLNVLKSLLFAMFLPTIIGSFTKLIGKGITSGSAPLFIRPMDTPQELDFKDNTFNFEDDSNKFALNDDPSKDGSYAYNQPEASQTQQQYAYNTVGGGGVGIGGGGINHQALSRYGGEQQKMQDSYLSALQSIGSASFKNSNGISGSSSGGGLGGGGGGGGGYAAPMRQKPAAPANMNTFQTFQKVPASSLLLSNYDPFYSPLLSRLDSVFAQLKLNSENEICREKLICLMYANPAKYAPYSNLVSAQLSRELNELRKPTSDNPDILRFFKYMRAAKDGQDGVDCEQTFDRCKEFKDFENPAMLSTYNDINKLVQARKLT